MPRTRSIGRGGANGLEVDLFVQVTLNFLVCRPVCVVGDA